MIPNANAKKDAVNTFLLDQYLILKLSTSEKAIFGTLKDLILFEEKKTIILCLRSD